MVGMSLIVGAFIAVIVAYVLSEALFRRFDVRRRILVGEGWPLLTIFVVNLTTLLVVSISSLVFLFAAAAGHYAHATIFCFCVQAVWLCGHLRFYYREHLRMGYEHRRSFSRF